MSETEKKEIEKTEQIETEKKEIKKTESIEKTETVLTLELDELIPTAVATDPDILLCGEIEKDTTAKAVEEIIADAPKYEERLEPAQAEQTTDSSSNQWYSKGNGTSYENSGIRVNVNSNGLITCLLVDMFVFSWVLPAYLSITGAIIGGVVSLIGSAISTFFSNIQWFSPLSWLGFSSMASLFGGVALLALSGLGVLFCVKLIQWFVRIMKAIINWHGKKIVGRAVFTGKSKAAPFDNTQNVCG